VFVITIGDRLRCALRRENGRRTRGHNDVDSKAHKLIGEGGKPVGLPARRSVFKDKVQAFRVTEFTQPLAKGIPQGVARWASGREVEQTDC
jgi:hypothetical protein